MSEKVELRLYGADSLPTLIYLPGLHGDWTLIGSFRRALGGRVRFVEMSYPHTLAWSLDEYAAAIELALAERGVTHGWLLGESFGSQVVWAILARKRFQVEGIILAGGFVCHPTRWMARLLACVAGGFPPFLLRPMLVAYAKICRFRYCHSPEVSNDIADFISRRAAPLDQQAARHRLRLVAGNDPCAVARQVQAPVYALTGLLDPVVPWFLARRGLRLNCPSLRGYKILSRADHAVLATAPEAAAELVAAWISTARDPRRKVPPADSTERL